MTQEERFPVKICDGRIASIMILLGGSLGGYASSPQLSMSQHQKLPCATLVNVDGDPTVYVVPAEIWRGKRGRYSGWVVDTADGEVFLSDQKHGGTGAAYLAAVSALGSFWGVSSQQRLRSIVTPAGEVYICPPMLRRMDQKAKSTVGWIVRGKGGGSTFFSDGKFGSAYAAYLAALEHLRLIHESERASDASALRRRSGAKASELPYGISGPVVRKDRQYGHLIACLLCRIPIFGKPEKLKWLYIGNENTYTEAKYWAVLERAKAMRARALAEYRRAAREASLLTVRAVEGAAKSGE
jgi:hypothetical protein